MSDHVKTEKIRNYSFQNSRRLPIDKMTEVNGIKIPSMPGSCYHAIICTLALNKNKFCSWDRIIEYTERYMRQYGGDAAWEKFVAKSGVKGFKQRIKDNTHTLTRTGKDCYGYRLHENGMAIYFFKDGAILFTGGEMKKSGDKYDVVFPDNRRLQKRYRGIIMTFNEYKKFVEKKYIDINGTILNHDAIRDYRANLKNNIDEVSTPISPTPSNTKQVCITLSETYDQNTANRLESMGLVVETALENEIIGKIPTDSIPALQKDKDVLDVVVISGEDL